MFLTQDDYRKIEEWLRTRTLKDSEFPHADPLRGNEGVPIIQDGKNKTLTINELVKQVAMMELPDFFNVTTFAKKGNLFLEQAISLVPVEQRKLGLTITFHSEKGHWLIYQFKGTSLNQWTSLNYWRSPIEEAIEELVLYPDEEDITGIRDGNRTFLKFKDKDYDPADFSGMGRIMLRKNLVGTEACSLDEVDHLLNVLTQDMIREENTVYIVQYDFDLDGKVISIPKGCTLWFQGGSINNGTIYLQETAILGAFEFADIGNAKLFGKFNTGQVMTFSDDSYKAKTEGYFVAGTKPSSATMEEDAKNERETFYDKNPNAYTTQNRQELRWWNGEEWILILDITDYNEIKSIINDLIEKHNAEMSACYQYFKTRCYAIETKVDGIEEDLMTVNNNITNITQSIETLSSIINNIDQLVENHVLEFIRDIGTTTSITVNGQMYTPDDTGNITLPNYPDVEVADRVVGTLRFTGSSTVEYDGSTDVEVNIPEEVLPNKPLTIKQGETILGIYDGVESKTISIPENTSGGGNPKPLVIKDSTGNTIAQYNSSESVNVEFKEISIQEIENGTTSKVYDPLSERCVLPLYKAVGGDHQNPVILLAGSVSRTSSQAPWVFNQLIKKEAITSVSIRRIDRLLIIDIVTKAGYTVEGISLLATGKSTNTRQYNDTSGGRFRASGPWMQCGWDDTIKRGYIRAWRTDDKHNDTINDDPVESWGDLLSFNIILIGIVKPRN